jgi:hypothetical protein
MYLSLLEDEAGGKKTLLTLAEEIEAVGEVDEDGKECVRLSTPDLSSRGRFLGGFQGCGGLIQARNNGRPLRIKY